MFSKKGYTFARAALHGLTILGLLVVVGASVPSAYAAAPSNDSFGTPVKITTAAYAQTIVDATQATEQATDPVLSCIGDAGRDTLWYTFVPTFGGDVKINTLNSAYDTAVAVWKNDPLVPGGLIEMGCNNNSGGGVTSALTLTLRGGVKYYIEVVRKSTWVSTPPDALRFSFTYSTKAVAYGLAAPGKIWDSTDGVFTFTPTGWQIYPYLGAYKNAIHLSNNRNNTATVYFDGEFVDLTYAVTPQMGEVNIFIDDVYQGTIDEGAGLAGMHTWNSPPLSDNVHKLQLTHFTTGAKANFDTIIVTAYADVLKPNPVTNLDLDGKDTGGADAVCGDTVSKVILTWKTPGDDHMVGTAAKYNVRYSLDPILVAADWNAAAPITSGVPKPSVGGTTKKMTVTGLVPGILYHFNVRAEDEVGNLGNLSNDCSAILSTGTPPTGAGMYDDKYVGWLYNGNWSLINNPDAYANTQHISTKVGSSAVFSFTGRQFVLHYKSGPSLGIMDVYIDGVHFDTIDQYSYYPDSRDYPGPILAYGPHIVRFKQSTPVNSNVDAILISNNNDGGVPDPIIDLLAVPGGIDGTVDLTWTATGDDPGSVGTATKYEIRMFNRPIVTDNDWYFADVAPGVLPTPQAGGLPEAITITDLVPGVKYWFAVRAFDNTHFYTDVSNTVNAVATYSGLYAGAGFYQDVHSQWQYYGFWNAAANPRASGGNQHASGAEGSSAVFHFNGTGFTLTYQKGPALGKLVVYVDGVRKGSINQNFAATVYKQPQTFSGFAAGNHVVQFVFEGGGDRVTIDAIKILP